MDVIFKEGMLYLQGVRFGKKTWRKIWMVLFRPSSSGVGRLEFHTTDSNFANEQKKSCRLKAPERKVVRLSDCLSVTFAPKESCPAGCMAFYLNTTQSTYTLASTTSQDWLSALSLLAFQKDPGDSDKGNFEEGNRMTMEDNDLYSSWKSNSALPPKQYQVTILSTEASKRCKLSGNYLVSPDNEAVRLLCINTGYIIYRWPYTLLRKFGQVEGGFSIEAGRRCDSGEGVFTFLTQHGHQIFQHISKQCVAEEKPLVRPLDVPAQPLSVMSPVILSATTIQSPVLPAYNPADVSADTEDESACHYSTINVISAQNVKQLSPVKSHCSGSKEAVGEEVDDEDEEEWCYSLESQNLGDVEGGIYYNFRRGTPPLIRKDQLKAETDKTECIYSAVKVRNSPSNLQLQPLSTPLTQPVHQPPLSTLTTPYVPPKPRNQHVAPVDNYIQPGYNTQAEAVDDTKETEEAISLSARVSSTEAPGSFKQRLAEIISKDLAKFQPPLPYRADSPTFSQ